MGKPPMDAEQVGRYLAERAAAQGDERGKWQGYAVVHRKDEQMVGEVGLYLHERPEDEGDLGFAFHPDYQGQGLATEAAEALVEYGFKTLGLRRITAHCDAGNAASSRLIERLGMRRQASESDSIAYTLTCEEWLALMKTS